MKVTVVVEKQPGVKNCSCFVEENIDKCMLAGYGKTVDEAVTDLLAARQELVKLGRNIPELEISFKYDLWAFFDKYPVNVSALAQRIGINPSLMRQYVAGVRRPSKKRVGEIETAMRDFGKELMGVSLTS